MGQIKIIQIGCKDTLRSVEYSDLPCVGISKTTGREYLLLKTDATNTYCRVHINFGAALAVCGLSHLQNYTLKPTPTTIEITP